jgi:hypothetical protein
MGKGKENKKKGMQERRTETKKKARKDNWNDNVRIRLI